MKTLSCDIVRDLLPLYVDEVVRETTKNEIERHLEICENCRKEAELMKTQWSLPVNETLQYSEAKVFKRLKKSLFRKKIVAIMLAVLLVVGVGAACYSYASFKETVVPFNDQTMTVIEQDGRLYISYDYGETSSIAGSVMFDPKEISVNGEKKTVVGLYYYETLWSKYVEPMLSLENGSTEITFALGDAEEIDQVYYGNFSLDGEDLNSEVLPHDMMLIWEKGE